MKRSPLPRRTKPISRSVPAKRGRKPIGRNKKRSAKAFAHAYHSEERVEFVKSLGCAWCRNRGLVQPRCGEVQNAHTGKKPGAGLKSHYSAIAPLGAVCHQKYDEHCAPFDTISARLCVEGFAKDTEARWLAYSGGETTND